MSKVRPKDAKTMILEGAAFLVGVCDFLEAVEDGEPKPKAAKKAIRRTKKRRKAIAETEALIISDEAHEVSPARGH